MRLLVSFCALAVASAGCPHSASAQLGDWRPFKIEFDALLEDEK
jgi:hypothetical protein